MSILRAIGTGTIFDCLFLLGLWVASFWLPNLRDLAVGVGLGHVVVLLVCEKLRRATDKVNDDIASLKSETVDNLIRRVRALENRRGL